MVFDPVLPLVTLYLHSVILAEGFYFHGMSNDSFLHHLEDSRRERKSALVI